MFEQIADTLERALSTALTPTEQVFIKLRGTFKEALACTSTRVIILKAGWMTGQIFGTDMFQCPYSNVAGAQVNFHLVTGYFELSTGGMQGTPKSFWEGGKNPTAAKSPNCVSISGRDRAAKFREACAFIMQKTSGGVRAAVPVGEDGLAVLERLARLRDAGVISAAEFQAKKAQILSRL
jgi:hypothetical protein